MKNKIFPGYKRIGKLILVMVALAVMLAAIPAGAVDTLQKQTKPQTTETHQNKYPPYPDVWDWEVPKEDIPIEGMNVKAMDNGDIMISYNQDRKDGKVKGVTFFGKTDVINVEAVYKGDFRDDAQRRIPFKNGFFLRTVGSGTRSGGCYDALGFDITVMDKSEMNVISSKKLLYVYDKPQFYETKPDCMDGPSFYYQVESVAADFLPLKDGTFLLVAPEGYVIRFDENFQTKSKLMNKRFFWMEEDAWLEFNVNGKYGDRANGDKDLKRLYNDLYKMLVTGKRR